jgi:hypothetical protein
MNKEMIDASSYDVGLIALIDRFAQFQNECADLFIEIAALHNDSRRRKVPESIYQRQQFGLRYVSLLGIP